MKQVRESEILAKEILQSYRNQIYMMSNEPLAEEIVNELKETEQAPVLVKTLDVQYIAVTEHAKKKLVRFLKCKQDKLWEELEELKKYQKEVEKSI